MSLVFLSLSKDKKTKDTRNFLKLGAATKTYLVSNVLYISHFQTKRVNMCVLCIAESPINGERNINKTSPSSKAASEVEPLSPLGSPLAPPTSAAVAAGTTAAAPSSGNSVVQPLDTSPYQSVFANSLSNGNNRNIVAALQQQQQYRDASMLSSPTTTSK